MTDTEHPHRLLGPTDPAPFRLFNPDQPRPLLLVCDHASRSTPTALDGLGLTEDDLCRHIAWDIGSAAVTERLAQRFDATALFAGYSRLFVDCNRAPGSSTIFPQLSDGTVVPGNHGLSSQDKAARLEQVFNPYHDAINKELSCFARAGTVPAFLSIHSFTPVLDGVERPWEFGVLWDSDPRLALPLIRALRGAGHKVGDNEPYSGRYPDDYTVDFHAEPAGLPHAGIEIRQDLLADEAGIDIWTGRLADALETVLDDNSIYSVLKAS
ncbi:MAG: N-formylglutamate amidohydrolase [Gammaproteobacteria bacterium]